MASATAVIVLTPNGRRVTVKVTPNTNILHVLEEACRKHGFDAKEYDLKHYNRIIDTANSFRFSGLPNNATLEMVQASRQRQETSINLGLQLESGKRLMHSFYPKNTLWEVIQHWEAAGENVHSSSDPNAEPVCVYMRQEIVGKTQLESRTLRSLGLTTGSACIRLLHRTADQLGQQANISAPLIRPSTVRVDDEEPPVTNEQYNHGQGQGQQHYRSDAAQIQPSQPVSRMPEQNNTGGKKRHLSLSPVPMDTDDTGPTVVAVDPPTFPLDLSANTAAAASTVHEEARPVRVVPRVSEPGALHVLGDHHALLYHADDVGHPSDVSLPDSFYELTRSDVESIYRDLQARRRELEDAPLSTATLRDQQRDEAILRNLHQHPNTIIRIRFRNRFVLQGIFRGVDTVAAVMNMVKTYLANEQLAFHLFTSPPKTVLDPDQRLVEAGLVGCAVAYFGCEEVEENYLNDEVCRNVSCPDAIDNYVRETLSKERPRMDPVSFAEGQRSIPSAGAAGPSSSAASSSKQVRSGTTSTRVPKWFNPK